MSKDKGRLIVKDTEIIRLNIERYRRMLQGELEFATRRAIETMLREFEAKLSVEECRTPSLPMVTEVPPPDQQSSSNAMNERATTKLFAWSLGGIFFAMLALNAAFR